MPRGSLLLLCALAVCVPMHVVRAQVEPEGADQPAAESPRTDVSEAPRSESAEPADAPAPRAAAAEIAPAAAARRAQPAASADADTEDDGPVVYESSGRTRGRAAGANAQDQALEDLLGLGMSERLGQTEAASRTAEDLLSAPATVTLLEHDEIRRSYARTVPDLLRVVPGVQVYQSAPGIYTVSLRGAGGITGNNIVVTIDGIPIASAVDGSIPWEALPISVRDLERVEVVRGPVSTIYGANAYTGVINLVTYRGYGHEATGAARVEAGIDMRGNAYGGASGRYVHQGRRFQQAHFGNFTYDRTNARVAGSSDAPAWVRGSVLTRLGLTTNAGQLDVEASVSAVRASEIEHLVPDPTFAPSLHTMAQARFVTRDLPSVLGRIGVWARERSLARFDAITGDVVDSNRNFDYSGTRAMRASFGFDVPLELHRTFTLGVGAQLDLDRIRAPYFAPDDNRSLYTGAGVYLQAAWDPSERIAVRAAVRGDTPPVTGEFALSYRLSVAYRGEKAGLRFSMANAYRAPTYVEAGARFRDGATGLVLLEGSPTILGPRNESMELALTFSPTSRFHGVVVGYFSRLIDPMIEDFQNLARRTFVNAPASSKIVGGEFQGTYRPLDNLSISASLGVLTYVGDRFDYLATAGVSDQNAQFVGNLRAHGTGLHERLGYSLSVAFASHRHYQLLLGMPPQFVDHHVGLTTQIGGMIEYELIHTKPLWLSLRVESNVPQRVESPFLGAARLGTIVTAGLEWRRD